MYIAVIFTIYIWTEDHYCELEIKFCYNFFAHFMCVQGIRFIPETS